MADSAYIVAIDFEVANLKSKVNAALAGVSGSGAGGSGSGNPKVLVNATGQVGALSGKLEMLSRSASDAVGRVADAFSGVVERAGSLAMTMGTIGAGTVLAGAVYGVTSLNSEIEKTQIGLADILTANGDTPDLVTGLGKASALMAKIRQDAAALPGETSDLARIFKLASIPGLQAGASTDQIESLSANAMAFGQGVVGMDSGTVSRELAMLLEGRAGAHNVLGLQLAGLGGDKAQEFNKKSGAERFEYLQKEFGKHQGSIDLFSNSFEGLSSTLKDNAKLFLTSATSPLFESVKRSLADANAWFASSPGTIASWANVVGSRLQSAFEWGRREVLAWGPAIGAFASDAYSRLSNLWGKLAPMVATAADAIKGALADGSALDKIESILKLYAAIQVGGKVTPFLSGALGGAMKIGGGMSALGGFGGAAGAAEGAAGAEAGLAGGIGVLADPVAWAGLAALAVAAVGAAGAVDDITSSASRYHTEALAVWGDISHGSKVAFEEIKGSAEVLAPAAREVADEMGINLLRSLRLVAGGSKVAAGWLEDVARFGATGHLDGSGGNRDKITSKALSGKVLEYDFSPDTLVDSKKRKALAAAAGGVHIASQVNNFNIATNEEPSRIARTIANVIAEKSRYPVASRHVPNYSRVGR